MEQRYKPRHRAAYCKRNLRRRGRAAPVGGSSSIRACGATRSNYCRCAKQIPPTQILGRGYLWCT